MPRSYIGTTTEVSVQSSPTNASVPSGRFQIAGITIKGPLNYSTIINSITQYEQVFGGRAPYETLYDTARTFFQEGGAELIVTRVVGPNATNGSVTLTDGAATSPATVATIEVKDPGAHSADYQAIVSHNTDGTFNVQVSDSITGRVIAQFTRAESPSDLVSLAMGNEAVIVRAASSTSDPAAGVFNFTAGNDDRAGITATTYGEALSRHKAVRAGVAVAAPGQHPTAIAPVLGSHCADRLKIGLLEIPAGMTVSEAKTIGTELLGTTYGASLSMPIYPAIKIPDGIDRSRTVSPVGYAAAHRAVTHRQLSYAAAVAGPRVRSKWSFHPVTRLDEDDVNELNNAGVNAIQSTTVPFLNNWSSLSDEPGLYDLNVQDCLNNLTVLLEAGLGELIWRPNDGRDSLRADAQAIVDGVMAPLVTGGWLFPSRNAQGSFTDNGYSVTVEDIRDSGQAAPYDSMQVNVAIKLSPTLRHIHVPIRKVDLRQGL